MSRIARWKRDAQFLRVFTAFMVQARKVTGESRTDFSDFLDEHFQRRADRPALIGESGSMTWRELDAFANRTAHWALSVGLERGNVVALLMENRPEYIAIWLGLSRVGIVTALLNTHLTGERLAHCLREARTRHLVVGSELVEAAASMLPELDSAPEILIAAGSEARVSGESGMSDPGAGALPGSQSFDALHAKQPESAIEETRRAGRRSSQPLFYIYTSGTTGLPKAAKVSHAKAVVMASISWKMQKLTARDRTYCCLPLYHSAGGVMATGGSLVSGGTLVIAKRFSAKRFWSDCAQHEVTSFQYIGELCRYLLNSPPHPDERSHKLRSIVGNGLRPEVWEPFQSRFSIPRIFEFYGSTEGNVALLNVGGRVGAVGYMPRFLRKLAGVEPVRFDVERDEIVRDSDGYCQRCAPGEVGELVTKITKTTRFEGYTNEEATQKKVLRGVFEKGDAYFRTGDLLRMDEDGYFYFVDRIGDTFRWKGENVATSEVAEVISVDVGVDEANVYGVPIPGADGRAGMAALVANDGFDLDRLGRAIEDGLAPYARPLFIRILTEMETTGTFKHRKVDLVREGFDPARLSDRLYFRDPEKGGYVPLDSKLFDRIVTGQIRV